MENGKMINLLIIQKINSLINLINNQINNLINSFNNLINNQINSFNNQINNQINNLKMINLLNRTTRYCVHQNNFKRFAQFSQVQLVQNKHFSAIDRRSQYEGMRKST